MVPPVATSRTRGTSCAETAVAQSKTAAATTTRRRWLFRRRVHVGMERIQMPVEEGPDAIPGIALLARVLRLPRLRVHTPIERVAAGRIVVDHGFGEQRLARAQRVHQLHI